MAELQTVDRRSFLKLSGLAAGIVLSGGAVIVGSVGRRPLGVAAASQAEKVQFAFPEYPDVVIAKLAEVKSGTPIFFEYPQPGQKNMLVKIDRLAEEGIGPDQESSPSAPPAPTWRATRFRLQPRVRHVAPAPCTSPPSTSARAA